MEDMVRLELPMSSLTKVADNLCVQGQKEQVVRTQYVEHRTNATFDGFLALVQYAVARQ